MRGCRTIRTATTACHSSQSTIQVEPAPLASVAPPEPAAVAAVELPGLHNVANTCMQPFVKGLVLQHNGIYNGWRFESVWLDK